jgi:hypothetical protein
MLGLFGPEDSRRNCTTKDVPAIGLYYLPNGDFRGVDSVSVEVIDGEFVTDNHIEVDLTP